MSYNVTGLPEYWSGAPSFSNPGGGPPPDGSSYRVSNINWGTYSGGLPTYGKYGVYGWGAKSNGVGKLECRSG
jgi:hypothetical protein